MKARVSVTIPVYNEIRFIHKTLESVIGDADEIILSDNASTDGTSDICQTFANKYPEIKYTRHKENMGAVFNGRFVLDQASGKYIRVMGAHDMLSIGSNQSMASLLDNNPDVVMVYSKYVIGLNADYSTRYFHEFNEFREDLLSDHAAIRTKSMITNLREFSIVFGLWRKDIFIHCISPRIFQSLTTDHTMLSSTAARGKLMADDKSIFFRMNPRDVDTNIVEQNERYLKGMFPSSPLSNNRSFWFFALIAEQYDMLIEVFGENSEISKDLLDFLILKFLCVFGESELTMDGMPPIISGKENFCQNLMTTLQKYRDNKCNYREKKKEKNNMLTKRMKKTIKYILPYGFYKLLQHIKAIR